MTSIDYDDGAGVTASPIQNIKYMTTEEKNFGGTLSEGETSKRIEDQSIVAGQVNSDEAARKLDYCRDIEPIIKKYHLENNDDCKKAVELIKKDDPKGYYDLSLFLIEALNSCVSSSEQRMIIAMAEKAAEMGLYDAKFFLGTLYIDGKWVGEDIVKGVKMIEDAFSDLFHVTIQKYQPKSVESKFLHSIQEYFDSKMQEFKERLNNNEIIQSVIPYDQLYQAYLTVSEIYETGTFPKILYI